MGATKQAGAARLDHTTPCVGNDDLCALSIIYKTLKKTHPQKKHWEFTGAVLG